MVFGVEEELKRWKDYHLRVDSQGVKSGKYDAYYDNYYRDKMRLEKELSLLKSDKASLEHDLGILRAKYGYKPKPRTYR